jgi:hypothetical protein
MGIFISMNIKRLIKEEVGLLLEKKIDQLVQNIEVTLSMDLIKHKGHVTDRSKAKGREGIIDYDTRPVTNSELKYFVNLFKKDISEKIIFREIEDGVSFVIKSVSKGLSIPLKPIKISPTYWQLVILTVWRESPTNVFRVGEDQVVIEK